MIDMFTSVNNATLVGVAPHIGLKPGNKGTFTPCPCCNATTRSDSDKRYPIGQTSNGKGWACHHCQKRGSIFDLVCYAKMNCKWQDATLNEKRNLKEFLESANLIPPSHRSSSRKPSNPVKTVTPINKVVSPKPVEQVAVSEPVQKPDIKTRAFAYQRRRETTGLFTWSEDAAFDYKHNLESEEGAGVYKYLTEIRKLDPDVIDKADLGCAWKDNNGVREYWLSIPLKDPEGKIINIRFRSVPPAKKAYRVCSGRPMPLYGADTLTPDNKKFIVIAEGELDVLALRSYGYTDCVVSGTTGAASNWTDEWLDVLEPYQGFYIWYDNDDAGRKGARKVAESLGKYRCFKINYRAYNDVGEALQNDVEQEDIDEAFTSTERFIDTQLRTVDEYEQSIEELINNPKKLRGIPTQSGKLDRCIGGIRSGLWVVTGDTGHGKTSWLTWLLWRQAKAGTPVMVTSFEQRPIGTVQKLLRMEVGDDFTKVTPDTRKNALAELGKLPIHILDHYGELNSDAVVETIRFSARRHKTKIALVDHLGFLANAEGGEERQVIEAIVRKLATVAVQDNICIMLVCHPNNTSVYQQRRVKISDLKGASAIRQDAHIAIVVERSEFNEKIGFPVSTLYIDKVRSEFGNNGSSCRMAFDPLSCCFGDTWEETPTGATGRKFTKGG